MARARSHRGKGGEPVREFYASQFIGHSPADAALHPISRTIATDQVIDEFVFEFTHDSEMPWVLPGVAPTDRSVRIPMVVVMGFEGTKVSYERIYWDQASVLAQIGLLEPSRLPASAAEQTERLLGLAGAAELADGSLPR